MTHDTMKRESWYAYLDARIICSMDYAGAKVRDGVDACNYAVAQGIVFG